MQPTLAPGEWWLARRTSRPQVGALVVIADPGVAGRWVVKRLTGFVDGALWVEGDNPEASTDSRSWGPLPRSSVFGVLWVRYRPWPPLRAIHVAKGTPRD